MRTLVLGGIRSGKSRWAENLIGADRAVRYIATGCPDVSDVTWTNRITTHRDRRSPNWETVESSDVAIQLRSFPTAPTLVDDVGGWLVSVFDRRGWNQGSTEADIDELVCAVEDFAGPLVLISPEVGMTVVPASESGRLFADELGATNQRLAQCCDQAVLIVAGLPTWLKQTNTGTTS